MRQGVGSGTVRMPLSSEFTQQRVAPLEREVERLSRSETKCRTLVVADMASHDLKEPLRRAASFMRLLERNDRTPAGG